LKVVEAQKEDQHAGNADPYLGCRRNQEQAQQRIWYQHENRPEHIDIQRKYKNTLCAFAHSPFPPFQKKNPTSLQQKMGF
jgi:hypothetical protein